MPDYPRSRGSKAERIRELAAKGLDKQTIARRLGVARPTVDRALSEEIAERHRASAKRSKERSKDTSGGNDDTTDQR